MHNKTIHKIAFLLLVVGGINWLLLGVFNWELAMLLGGSGATLSKALYILFGLAAVYELISHKGTCTHCGAGGGARSEAPEPESEGGM